MPGPTSAEPAPSKPKREPRLSKGERLVLGASIAYSLGASVHWATAGASGMLEGRRPGGSSGVTLGFNLGGAAGAGAVRAAGPDGREGLIGGAVAVVVEAVAELRGTREDPGTYTQGVVAVAAGQTRRLGDLAF